jgi:hypothetical protein
MWRLSQGPVALTFLTERVQDMMNANISGVHAEFGDVVLERDQETGVPRFRLRDIQLRDTAGNLIAMAPRAAIDVSGRALLAGRIQPIEFDLIGARIVVRRELGGSFQFDFGAADAAASAGHTAMLPDVAGKQDRFDKPPTATEGPDYQTAQVLQFLDQELLSEGPSPSAISSLISLRISQASISIYDQANKVWWHSPEANLVFRRVAYGFALFADASIASSGAPWRTEVVANYKANARTFTVSARVFDLVPADIAQDVFALSRLAQVRLPLSGHAEVEFTREGEIIQASAELNATAGRVGFPGYISEPLLIDEGLVRLDYEPSSGHLVIGDSVVFMAGRPTRLSGRIEPVRAESGMLSAAKFELAARSTEETVPLPLDRIEIRGVASIDEARLDLDDLLLMSGDSGLRARGRFVGGDGAVGVYLEGIARDLPADLIKTLWPPIVAGGGREWMTKNILAGHISDAAFRVGIPSETLAAALEGQPIPEDMAELTFTVAGIEMRYLDGLPPVRGVSGSGRLTGDTFRVELADGMVTVPSGDEVQFLHGTMTITELANRPSPAVLRIDAAGGTPALLELIDLKPLHLVTKAGFDRAKFDGEASGSVVIEMPLARQVDPASVRVAAQARMEKAQFRDALEGMNIEDGQVAINVDDTSFRVTGPVQLNGIAANLAWTRLLGADADGEDEIVLTAELDEADRQRLGAPTKDFIGGPVGVKVTAHQNEGRLERAYVEADLTGAELKLDAVGWAKPAGDEASASFDLNLSRPGSVSIANLSIVGDQLQLAGGLTLDRGGRLQRASFPTVRLGRITDVAVNLMAEDDGLAVSVTGRTFDARPLIAKLFSTSTGAPDPDAVPMRIDATVGQVLAHRGEVITSLKGTMQLTGGIVDTADLTGNFRSGAPVSLTVVPGASDLRELRLTGGDGGAALRAADLYSKISGGNVDFRAWLGPGRKATVQRGLLQIDRFEVVNEVALSEVGLRTGESNTPASRRDGFGFSQLTLPFSVDDSYIRIGDALVSGPEMGASAQGHIRKADGHMDIGGTIIPAYAINALLTDVPLVGQILTGGKGEGIFGLTYALRGPMRDPQFLINPVSAIAPGILRRFFDIGGGGVAADGTKAQQRTHRFDTESHR